MTALITVCFIARSSSLVSWIPLALFKIIEDGRFFVPIVIAGITVALPLCLISVLIDSYFYGVICVPQFNFVVLNVIENVSAFFGKEPVFYYFKEFPELFSCPLYKLGLYGFSLLAVRQMMGTLRSNQKLTMIPVFLIYSVTYIWILCLIEHKEHRFILPVICISNIGLAYFWEEVYLLFESKMIRKGLKNFLMLLFLILILQYLSCVLMYPVLYFNNLDIYYFFNNYVPQSANMT